MRVDFDSKVKSSNLGLYTHGFTIAFPFEFVTNFFLSAEKLCSQNSKCVNSAIFLLLDSIFVRGFTAKEFFFVSAEISNDREK